MKDFATLCMTSASTSRYLKRNFASVGVLALALLGAAILPPPSASGEVQPVSTTASG